jgi:hypothetical protein
MIKKVPTNPRFTYIELKNVIPKHSHPIGLNEGDQA